MSDAVVRAGGQSSRKVFARFPVYQIDFSAVACGKTVSSSKRRIRWRFGFSNQEALGLGETGTACRGEEHDVTLIWSVTSGKRLIFSDGQELHYSTNRTGVFEYSWTMRGNHVVKVIAHAAPPMSGNPGFRQYDLFVDGLSFFNFPKVFELGVKGTFHAPYPGVVNREERPPPAGSRISNTAPVPAKAYYDLKKGEYVRQPQTVEEEDLELKKAIQASLEESRTHLSKSIMYSRDSKQGDDPGTEHFASPAPQPPVQQQQAPPVVNAEIAPASAPDTDLLDLLGDLTVQPSDNYNNSASIVPTGKQPEFYSYDGINVVSTDSSAPTQAPYDPFGAQTGPTPPPPGQTNPYLFDAPNTQTIPLSAPPPVHDPFAPQPVPSFAPHAAPTMPHYAPLANQSAPPVPFASPSNTSPYYAHSQPPAPFPSAPPPTPTVPNVQERHQPPLDDALKKLVNFDDISSPADAPFSLSMNNNLLGNKGPSPSSFVGPQPSLAQMQSLRPAPPKKEVLVTNPPNNSALVSHTQQNGNYSGYTQPLQQPYNPQQQQQAYNPHQSYAAPPSGPPPLQQQRGFGVGATYNQHYASPPPQQQWGS